MSSDQNSDSSLVKEVQGARDEDLRSGSHRQNFIDEAIRRVFFAKERSRSGRRQIVITPAEQTMRLFKERASANHNIRRSAVGSD